MSEFLRDLGFDPSLYWSLALISLLVWFVSTALPFRTAEQNWPQLNRPWIFCSTLLVALFAWRWPALYFYRPVNPDEAQFLSAAISMLARRDIWWPDTMTSGPLVVLPLTLPGLLGCRIDHVSGRIVSLFLNWGMLVFAYGTFRHWYGDKHARALLLPLASFFVFLIFWDFVPYCSEMLPLFLCSLAIWLSATSFGPGAQMINRVRLSLGGFILGMMPFSKLQVIPLGAALGISVIFWILRQPPPRQVARDLRWLGIGVLAGFGLMSLSLWASGNLDSYYQAYLLHNVYYTTARAIPWLTSSYLLTYLTRLSWGFASFHAGLLGLLVFSMLFLRQIAWRLRLLGWVLVAAGYTAVVVPGRLYPHYLLFLTLPLAYAVSVHFGSALQSAATSARQRIFFWLLFLSLGVGGQLLDRLYDPHSLHRLVSASSAWAQTVGFINSTKQPGDSLAVWGWRPELYVETQLPQATRGALTEAQFKGDPQHLYFRKRFLTDLQAARPAFFVDSVGPLDFILKDRSTQAHETIPGLKEYVEQNYALVSRTAPIRVFVRHDLLKR